VGLKEARRGIFLGGAYEQSFAGVGHQCRDCRWRLQRAGKSAGETSGNTGGRDDTAGNNASSFATTGASKIP
jgi:hypothetical protein